MPEIRKAFLQVQRHRVVNLAANTSLREMRLQGIATGRTDVPVSTAGPVGVRALAGASVAVQGVVRLPSSAAASA